MIAFSYWLFAEQLIGRTTESEDQPPMTGTRMEVPVFSSTHHAGTPVACDKQSVYRYMKGNYNPEEKKELELISTIVQEYVTELKKRCPLPMRIGFYFREKNLSAWIVTNVASKDTLAYYEVDLEMARKYEDSGILFESELCNQRFCCNLPNGYIELPLELLNA